MAARVLHFGWDDCYRVHVLERAGYAVKEAKSIDELELDLKLPEAIGAVILSEDHPGTMEQAVNMVRRRTAAPIILFRRSNRDLDERQFDEVYPWFVQPEVWLTRTAELIAQSQKTLERSAILVPECKAVREKTQELLKRTRSERARNKAVCARNDSR